ncbi:hypothetical protein [Zwartia vadi]|uniref:hypothetical protein n=1 Tax=Zwartia vadi TaxID=3058168 RepID=UPI0025B32DA8|nr:hypothetical protein [Zwartia vadi]MDN3988681.1 hypothetical protein [Zwartia vadi]
MKFVQVLFLSCCFYYLDSNAQSVQSRGVNPAEIDTRIDLINDFVRLNGGGNSNTTTVKFDKKLNDQTGVNFEMPFAININSPGFNTSGNGDLFSRFRYMVPLGGWTIGASAEVVLPLASSDALGKGRYLLGVGALAVKPWSNRFITAFVAKTSNSIGGYNTSLNQQTNVTSASSDLQNYTVREIRFMPIFILDNGWALVGEARQSWGQLPDRAQWTFFKVDLNKQFTANWAATIGINKTFGDLQDMGGVSASVKYFF